MVLGTVQYLELIPLILGTRRNYYRTKDVSKRTGTQKLSNVLILNLPSIFPNTVETPIKEPVFIKTLRQKFNLLNPINKKPPEAETRRGSCITGFMCSEFLRISKNSYILIRILVQRLHDL